MVGHERDLRIEKDLYIFFTVIYAMIGTIILLLRVKLPHLKKVAQLLGPSRGEALAGMGLNPNPNLRLS